MQTKKQPILSFKDFKFSYEGNFNSPTLDIADLTFFKGEVALLTGISGCGKSTLAKAAIGILKDKYPHHVKGSILIDGKRPIEELTIAEISITTGLVQQDPDSQLCTFTVEQEIAFGLENLRYPPEEIEEKIDWALGVTNTKHLRNRETSKLSGGEKQRVVLASIIALTPKFLILDEPTANIDPEGTTKIVELIKSLQSQKDITILIIEHKLNKFIPFTDRFLVMDNGKIVNQIERKEITKLMISSIPNIRPLNLPTSIIKKNKPDYDVKLLEIHDLNFSYGKKDILKKIDLSLAKNEILGIIGPNGAGKTTLLQCINGILSLKNEDILIYEKKDISFFTPAKRAKFMGTVFQNPNFQIFERTVKKELLFTADNLNLLSPELIEKAKKLSEMLNLTKYEDKTPFALSHGEKKRLTVASVTLHNPSVILLDEPFIGQDYRNSLLIIEQLESKPWSLILVSHDPELMKRICDRVLFINEGTILVDDHPSIAFQKIEELGWKDYNPPEFEIDKLNEGN